jgi:hypothetical protein
VLTSARKFKELSPANAPQLEEISEIDLTPRRLDGPKWKVLQEAVKGE